MNKRIIITGASSGIGLYLAKYYIEKKYEVIGVSRKKPEELDCTYFECDLTNQESIRVTTNQILTQYNQIDVLINCAGVGVGGALENTQYDDVNWVMQVNVLGLMSFTEKLLQVLRKTPGSKIINVGSVAGEITIPFQTIYSMSKSSIQRYTEGLRLELKPFGVQATSVLPGDTKTGFTSNRVHRNPEGNPYYDRSERSIRKMEQDEQSGVSPMKVVKVIDRLVRKRRLPIQVTVGLDYKLLVFLKRLFPKRIVEYIIYKMYAK